VDEIDLIAEPLRKALAAYYSLPYASPSRMIVITHVFGLVGPLLMPQLDELARNVRLEPKSTRSP
jgi:hypothetical protein